MLGNCNWTCSVLPNTMPFVVVCIVYLSAKVHVHPASTTYVQEHLQEVKRREEAQQAAQAAKREEADRIYARLKAEKEAAMAAEEEQHFLINLLRQEEAAERDRQTQADRAAYRVRSSFPRLPVRQQLLSLCCLLILMFGLAGLVYASLDARLAGF